MKRFFWAFFALFLLGCVLIACGGSNSNPNAPNVSGLTKRVYASNSLSGIIYIIDASKDVFSNHIFTIATSQPQQMSLALDRSVTLVWNNAGNAIHVLDNTTEQPTGAIPLPGFSDSFVALNNTNAFATVRNANELAILNLQGFTIAQTIPLITPKQMAVTPNGKTLVVMSDSVPDTINFIDTAAAISTPLTAATPVTSASFDHPVYAVFSSDSSKAFVINCGPECGGTTAGVTQVNMTTTPPSVVSSVPVPGGSTVALLNSTTLYVAGNDTANPPVGHLTKVDTSSMTAGAPVTISDGYHWKMGLGTNNKLFIGSKTCTNARCLTVFDTGNSSVYIEQQDASNPSSPGFGDVKGIAPITGVDRVYLAQGSLNGEIRIFDTTTGLPLPQAQQLDAVGNVQDVILVDP